MEDALSDDTGPPTVPSSGPASNRVAVRGLYFLHFGLLVLIALTYFALGYQGAASTPVIRGCEFVAAAFTAVWVVIAFGGAVAMDGGDAFLKAVFAVYRRALGKPALAIMSIVVLSALLTLLAWQLLAFTPLKFTSEQSVTVTLNDVPGRTIGIGQVPASPCDAGGAVLRVPVGDHMLALVDASNGEALQAVSVHVPRFWNAPVQLLPCQHKERRYEVLR